MEGMMAQIELFHRLYLFFLMGTGMALLGTAALFVRWEIGPAIRCLRGWQGKGKGKKQKRPEGTQAPVFRLERERIAVHSRERIGGKE